MQLQLPESWTMHNVFHVSWFKPYVGPPLTKVSDEQQPEVLDEAEVVEHDHILLHRWKHGLGRRQRQYLTKFRDRCTHEAIWLDGDFFIEYPQCWRTTWTPCSYRQFKQKGMSRAPPLGAR